MRVSRTNASIAVSFTIAISYSLSPVLRGEGWGEGLLRSEISNLQFQIALPLSPALSPEHRREGGWFSSIS
jgi:hypothetical protein